MQHCEVIISSHLETNFKLQDEDSEHFNRRFCNNQPLHTPLSAALISTSFNNYPLHICTTNVSIKFARYNINAGIILSVLGTDKRKVFINEGMEIE